MTGTMLEEKDMRDVVAHHICSSDASFHVASLEDVERVMVSLGFPRTERLESAEGAWLRFYVSPAAVAAREPTAEPRHVGGGVAAGACRSASEYAYDLKLPVHLHVAPNPATHFRPFLNALRFFIHPKPLPFHLKNAE